MQVAAAVFARRAHRPSPRGVGQRGVASNSLAHNEAGSDLVPSSISPTPRPHVYPASPFQFTPEHIRAINASGPFPAPIVQWIRSDHAGETGAVWIYKGALAAANLRSRLAGRAIPAPPESPLHSHTTSETPLTIESVRNQHKDSWQLAYDMIHVHLVAEQQHLNLMDAILKPDDRSFLVGLWKIMGFALGFLPTVVAGPPALFATVAAVETYVETHYMGQILLLDQTRTYPELKQLLEACCADEVQHQTDSARRFYITNSDTSSTSSKHSNKTPDENLTFYNSLGPLGKLWYRVVEWGSEAAVSVAKKI